MAFTNFTGPVRSDDGFEQLVDGVWTPVGGGGEVVIVPTGGDETYTLDFTEVGQMITVVAQGIPGAEDGNINIDVTVPGTVPNDFTVDGTIINSRETTLQVMATEFPLAFDFLYGGNMVLQFVYTGTFETLYGEVAYFKVNGQAPLPAP